MKRYENVDILRGAACLLVLVYHIYAITGLLFLDIPVIKHIHIMGGAIGVTIFFVLSGYGIFFSLDRMEKNGYISFKEFIKKRLIRICPQYYLNIFVMLLLTSSAVYLSREHLWNIVLHIFFLHSLTIASHGAINGVLWTMSVIFQFYIVAIPLYKVIKKIDNVVILLIMFVGFTIIAKYLVLNFLWVENIDQFGAFATMIPGRQLFTSLDNFGIGMLTARLSLYKSDSKFNYKNALFIVFSMLVICLLAVAGCRYSISERNLWGYIYYSLLSFAVGALIIGISFDSFDGPISKFFLFISHYEYTIYLWHLPIIRNLYESTTIVGTSSTLLHRWWIYIVMTGCSIVFGIIIDRVNKKNK